MTEGEAVRHLVDRIDRFSEAVSLAKRDRVLSPIEADLRKSLSGWWDAQRRDVLSRLAAFRGRFAESISGDEFDPVWSQTSDATRDRIVPAFDDTARRALDAGLSTVVAELAVEVDFDLDNPRAVEWLRGRGAERVTLIDATTRDRLRTVLADSAEGGWSWNRTAREIRETFDGFSGRGPMGRHLRDRAEHVAVTETAEAYGEANSLIRDRLDEQGLGVEKRWVTVGDGRVSDGCRSNASVGWIPHRQTFPSGDSREPRFPGCRCSVVTRVPTDDQET